MSVQEDEEGADSPELDDAGLHPRRAKKRRTAGSSSRGVANLTPEQLARKRANDREAQRAIRERTKGQIDRLNQRIHELESQQPYRDLQLVLRDKEVVEAENADLRKRLEGVAALVQPVLRAPDGLNVHPAHSRTQNWQQQQRRTCPLLIYDARSPRHTDNSNPSNTPSTLPACSKTPRQHWLFPGNAPTIHAQQWSGESEQFPQDRPSHAAAPAANGTPFDERLGVEFLLANSDRNKPLDPNLYDAPSSGYKAPSMIPHLTLPRNGPASCALDVILLEFLATQQARGAKGVPTKALVGPLYPNFTALVYPERTMYAHPLSRLFTDVLRTFPDIRRLPEQVAIVYIMFLLMRWYVEPTQENYDRLPEWCTPRASQLFVSHPLWIDYVPWPRLRDRLITVCPEITFEIFFVPYTTTISLNWPYEAQDCLLPASKVHSPSSSAPDALSATVTADSPQPSDSMPGGLGDNSAREDDRWVINPAFESHLRDLNNWSLGSAFKSAFPALVDTVRFAAGV
ncbi:hypothetical protein BDV95DRAFT_627593 [Massariosphaeria phaeospora]|uniref:BZIP transcription factor n=1 Tax=Massariosphaeria phaeospora TaxID=100035 RepID=A0A7C8IGN6_9PLEO|nr:hypothetical protein BDV95DRAFT_627593 [Massariosphaeria phaeospora]